MPLIKKLESATSTLTTSRDAVVGVMLTHSEINALIKAMRLSDAVWSIAKS